MARKSRTTKTGPDRPDLPKTFDRAPEPGDGDLWDGVEAGPGTVFPEHVADLQVHECRFRGVDLAGRTLSGLHCRDTEFVQCDLSGAILDDAVFTRVTFTDCRLTGAELNGAGLNDVRIEGCRADLVRLRMARGAFLCVEDTVLRGADLYRFTAKESAFLRCDLGEASLEDARLAGTDLHGSTLESIRGPLALQGTRIGPDQLVPVGALLLAALGVQITDG
ncbi:pentapeptide repeat-containing protein [Pseudonocardia pini]|uniref:pentapeptide repeat-containing protein n=1 Tax=Pseudonocardia pini TaxID=2758030 RepID=UPI0015EFFDB6|nr:pentapeptide repeat-containing protein [Pseudonocardia pini]